MNPGKKSVLIVTFCTLILCAIVSFFSELHAQTDDITFPEPDPPHEQGDTETVDQSDAAIQGVSQKYIPMADGDPKTEWRLHKSADQQHPDGEEQQMMWLMNRARANPTEEGLWLASTDMGNIGRSRNYFNVDVDLLKQEYRNYSPKAPAAFDVRLHNAAREHSQHLIQRDSQDHDGQFEAIDATGFSWNRIRGNVFAYAPSGINAHGAFSIDWGHGDGSGMQTDRGHRKAVMSLDGDYTNVGIAAVRDSDPATQVGPLVISGNYCSADTRIENHYNRFIVGTVWRDANQNNVYDPGEGVAGTTVSPDNGPYYAVTANSGGYAIPILASGSYAITFSGAALGGNQVQHVTVAAQSVLLDLELSSDTVDPPETDPATDQETDPATDQETDPATDQETDPATDQETDPATDQETDPDKNDDASPGCGGDDEPIPGCGSGCNPI